MTSAISREEVLEAIQEKRRGGWHPESIPGRNGDEEGKRALEQIERNAVSDYLRSEEALVRLARAIAEQRFRARGIPIERLTEEDVFFCETEAGAIQKALAGTTEVSV